MNEEKEQLLEIIKEHPEICASLLALLRLIRGQTLPPASIEEAEK